MKSNIILLTLSVILISCFTGFVSSTSSPPDETVLSSRDNNNIFGRIPTVDDISEFNERSSLKKEKDGLDINKKIEVNCIDIKEILEKHNQIDLIKIDIEGSEYEVMPEIIKNKNKIKMVLCETHGNPDGKKIPSVDGSKLVVKNKIWIKDYKNLISKLKEMNLYGNWFYEWY